MQTALHAEQRQLFRLLGVRAIAIVGFALQGYVLAQFSAPLPYGGLSIALLVWSLALAFSGWRWYRGVLARYELLLQLLLDVACAWVVLYCSGGFTNPFVSFFLLPLVVAAAILSWRQTLWVMLSVVVAYASLMLWYWPISAHDMGHQHGHADWVGLHLLGMGLNFTFSAVVVGLVVTRMAAQVQQRDQQLAALQTQQLRDEHVLNMATLAAGAAHEMGTPLSTLAVGLNELARDPSLDPEWQAEVAVMRQQLQLCQGALSRLAATAQQVEFEETELGEYIGLSLEQCRLLHPQVAVSLALSDKVAGCRVRVSPLLQQIILNLLHNAAQSCHRQVQVSVDYQDATLQLRICDDGRDTRPVGQWAQPQQAQVSTHQGLGLGLFLSQMALQRLGGQLTLLPMQPYGVEAQLSVPLQAGV